MSLDTRARDGARALCQGAPVSEFVEALDPETRRALFYWIVAAWSESAPPSTHSPEIASAARRLGWLSGERYKGARREYLRACMRGEFGADQTLFGSQAQRFTVPTMGSLLVRLHPGAVLVNEGPTAIQCDLVSDGIEPAVVAAGGEEADEAAATCGATSADGSLACGLAGSHSGLHIDTTQNIG